MSDSRKRKIDLGDIEGPTPKKQAMEINKNPTINHWNGRTFTKQYFDILEKRKALPVWEQKESFLKIFKENQVIILQGETGSGKTTQVCFFWSKSWK